VIDSTLGSVFHGFWDRATYSFKLSTENCGQTAADGNMVTIDSLFEVAGALSDGTIVNFYDLPFSHNTAQLTY